MPLRYGKPEVHGEDRDKDMHRRLSDGALSYDG